MTSQNYKSTENEKLQTAQENIWKKEMDEERNYPLFDRLFILVQVFAVATIALIACWMGFWGGGYGFQDQPKQEFRWHPLLMSVALLFINGESILLYRGFRYHRKVYTKTIHGSLQACGVAIMLVGLKAVYDAHNLNRGKLGEPAPITNFYSVHSWVGLMAMGLYAMQWAAGFTFFVLPAIPLEWRKGVLPSHRLSGVFIFLAAMCAALMGVAELSAWSMTCWTEHNEFCLQMFVGNAFALVILIYSALVLFLVSNPFWARQPLPSENEEAPVYGHDPLNKKLIKGN